MGLEGYTSPVDPIEESAKLDQQWYEKNEDGIKELNSTEIKDYYKKNYDLAGELIEKHLGKFLKKQNITNFLMQSIDNYEEELVKVHSNAPDKDEELLDAFKNSVISSVSRNFNNMDIKISDDERRVFVAGILSFVEELQQKLLEKHGLTDLDTNNQ